jgi:pre-mRNA-splicing factor SYF1
VHTVQPRLATGKFFTLWTAFAKYYESNGQLNDARTIFEQSLKVPFSKVDDLATIWCEYAEMELRHE